MIDAENSPKNTHIYSMFKNLCVYQVFMKMFLCFYYSFQQRISKSLQTKM